MTKRTTTQWTTTTTRTSDAKRDTIGVEIDTIFDGLRWDNFIKSVDDMPLGYAVKLRDKLNNLFSGAK